MRFYEFIMLCAIINSSSTQDNTVSMYCKSAMYLWIWFYFTTFHRWTNRCFYKSKNKFHSALKKTKSMLTLMKMLYVDVFVPIWIYCVDVRSILGSFAKAWWRKRFIGTFAIADSTNQRLSTFAQGQLMFISFNNL